jgi:hypothetical protein
MITPIEIRSKAEKKYTAFLRAWLAGETFFPLQIPGRLASGSTPWEELSPWIRSLNAGSKAEKGVGYTVHFGEPIVTRKHGKQTLPEKITIESQVDFLPYIQKSKEFQQFVADVGFLRTALPQLEEWLQNRPQVVIDHAGTWPELVAVCKFLMQNPRPGHYIRELPVQVHSKFIEHNKGVLRDLLDALMQPEHIVAEVHAFEDRFGLRKPPITFRFRVLDPALQANLNLPSSDVSIPLDDFAKLPIDRPKVIVCENLMPFLTIPPIANGIAIFGEGNAVSALAAPWLETAEITYWGDLDIQGFRFLANLRKKYTRVQSIFMDVPTLEKYRTFCVAGVTETSADPVGLSAEELAAYTLLKKENLRLEQERILHADVLATLASGKAAQQ